MEVPEKYLGLRMEPRWRDMSEFVVHFTKDAETLGKILAEGRIEATKAFGWGRKYAEVTEQHTSACFSEVPLDQLARIRQRHGMFGLGFRKATLTKAGGGRVWYLDHGSASGDKLYDKIGELGRLGEFSDPLWSLTPFIDLVIPTVYEFTWEREWRVPRGLSFALSDIAFLIVPTTQSRSELIEAIEVPLRVWVPGEPQAQWWSIPELLGDYMDILVSQFLRRYVDPLEFLYFVDGEYMWPGSPVDTADAVDAIFADLEPSVRTALVERLEEMTSEWVDERDLSSN